jgi:hypothetical protein
MRSWIVSQALQVPVAFVRCQCQTSRDRALSAHLKRPTSLLGLLTAADGVIALLPGLLPPLPSDRQFVLHPLESLLDSLLLADHTLERLIPGEPLMGQFGLEVVDRRQGLLKQMFRALSGLDLLPQSLPRYVELVARSIILIPMDHRNRDLAIPDEAPTL